MTARPAPDLALATLTRDGVRVEDRPVLFASLRASFDRHRALVLPGFLGGELLEHLQRRLAAATMVPAGQERFYRELGLRDDDPLRATAYFLMNDPELFAWIERLTGCPPIGRFSGRIFRRLPDPDHYDHWHDDSGQSRRIGISINLGSRPFLGGAFRLRDTASGEVLFEHRNTGPGDAVLFRIDAALSHMVLPLLGREPRTVLAGWFRQEPDFRVEMFHPIGAAGAGRAPAVGRIPGRLRRPPTVLQHVVDGQVLLHSGEGGATLGLDATGAEVYRLLAETGSVAAAVRALRERYQAPAAVLREAVRASARRFLARGLLAAERPAGDRARRAPWPE